MKIYEYEITDAEQDEMIRKFRFSTVLIKVKPNDETNLTIEVIGSQE
jgi:hypothetical protein